MVARQFGVAVVYNAYQTGALLVTVLAGFLSWLTDAACSLLLRVHFYSHACTQGREDCVGALWEKGEGASDSIVASRLAREQISTDAVVPQIPF